MYNYIQVYKCVLIHILVPALVYYVKKRTESKTSQRQPCDNIINKLSYARLIHRIYSNNKKWKQMLRSLVLRLFHISLHFPRCSYRINLFDINISEKKHFKFNFQINFYTKRVRLSLKRWQTIDIRIPWYEMSNNFLLKDTFGQGRYTYCTDICISTLH